MLRGLSHPNIIKFFGAGTCPNTNRLFFVIEHFSAATLHHILNDNSNEVMGLDRLRFALDIAKGMKYLHASTPSRIHCNLNTHNLLVRMKWVKVAGFGAAQNADSKTDCYSKPAINRQAPQPAPSDQRKGHSRRRRHLASQTQQETDLSAPLLSQHTGNAVQLQVQDDEPMAMEMEDWRWRSPEAGVFTTKSDVFR